MSFQSDPLLSPPSGVPFDLIHRRRVRGVKLVDGPSGARARIEGTGIDVFELAAAYRWDAEHWDRLKSAFHWLPDEQLEAALLYARLYAAEINARVAALERFDPRESEPPPDLPPTGAARFYLDEPISPAIAVVGRLAGVQISSAQENGRVDAGDDAQLLIAGQEGRILVTANSIDYVRLSAHFRNAGLAHAGVLILPPHVPPRAFRRFAAALVAFATRHPRGLVPYSLTVLPVATT